MSAAEIAAIAGSVIVLLGTLFMIIGALGMVRMPDVFTRLHAASVSDTFGVGLILVGLILIGGLSLVSFKLAFLLAFLFLTGPVATHAVARAALDAGVKPLDAEGAALAAANDDDDEGGSP
ncbi:MAG: monovalent cation/H(+) antiporter subunit G [Bauldia sp.]|nr:monovalent cation/H(+) antiporter subunit G [Bauldia sp.]